MKSFYVIILALVSISLTAQEPELPLLVKNSFKKAYPEAVDLNWAQNHGNYEIEFYLGTELYTATYDINGILLETAVIIIDELIPEKLLSEIAKKHPEAGLAYAEIVTTAGEEKYIRVVAESENMVYTVKANLNGTIIRIDTQNFNTKSFDDNQDVE